MSARRDFRKVLIANRGEIARRIQRSARELGLSTVAVYSDADADALHVREADQAVRIGGARPAESYLDIEALIRAARLSGAQAVHPGYGFLAENEEFAEACERAGLVFIGPPAQAIRAMGNKALAKSLMEQAGVRCIPGYRGEDQSEATLEAQAAQVGYPVMIKATAGGGGRGMRLVRAPAEFLANLRSARSEAQAAFGDAEVMLERAIIEPRHVEIQIFADRHGHAIHLGERDCSIQRRHQKLVEESPSPAVDEALRERMGATAVAAARAIGYEGAGTIEFLLDREGAFYFMEANTRLQVEHPVTEAVCGVDLVEWQFRVAAGEALPLRQEDVRWAGHAIEVRLCAEDPMDDFRPQSGTVALWRPPEDLRVEHALRDGVPIAPYYDSMIAKLVAHGSSREEARRRLVAGLERLAVLGVATNRDFLVRCLEHPAFVAGEASTAFVDAHADALRSDDAPSRDRLLAVAAALLCEPRPDERRSDGGLSEPIAHPLAHRLPMLLRLEVAGEIRQVTVRHLGAGRYEVGSRGAAHEVEAHEVEVLERDASSARVCIDGLIERVWVASLDAPTALVQLHLSLSGQSLRVSDHSRRTASSKGAGGGDGAVRASAAGRVVAVHAQPGQPVKAGQAVLTLESMKMEHEHSALADGVLVQLMAMPGDQVQAGQLLAQVEVSAPPGAAD